MEDQLEKRIAAIEGKLSRLLLALSGGVQSEEGLRTIDLRGGATSLWVKRGSGNCLDKCWYILGPNDVPMYVDENSLTGTLTGINTYKKEFEGKPSTKISFDMIADGKPYKIRSTIGTVFTKGVLISLKNIPENWIGNPITIGVKPSDQTGGKEANIVFGEVFIGSMKVSGDWEPDANDYLLLEQVAAHLGIDVTDTTDQGSGQKQPQKSHSAPSAPAKTSASAPATTSGTYPVKGVQVPNNEAATYFFRAVKSQLDRIGKDGEWGKNFVSDLYGGRDIRQLSLPELEELTQRLARQPAQQSLMSDDDIPF